MSFRDIGQVFLRCFFYELSKYVTVPSYINAKGRMKKFNSAIYYILSAILIINSFSDAQTNPAAQAVPYFQNFGTNSFNALPSGTAIWNGVSGGTTTTQAVAEASAPLGNGTITAATVIQAAGGVYGYVASGNAQMYVQSSGNSTNGVNQLALAINTMEIQNVTVSYKITMLFSQPRSIGVVLQYRIGTSGGWTSIDGTSYYHNNMDRLNGAEDLYTDLILPANAGNQPVVQLRWAIWRGTETGTSAGIGIDDISVSSTGNGIIVPNPKLFSLNFVTSDKIHLVWEAPTFGDDSVLVFARQDSSVDYIPLLLGRNYTNSNANYSSAGMYGNSKLVYNGTDNNTLISGLTVNKKYYFRAFAYRDTITSSGTLIIFDTTEVHGVLNLTAHSANGQATIAWQNYRGHQGIWWHEVMIVGASSGAVDAVPTGDGSSYTAYAQFGTGSQIGANNFAVYKGTADAVTVTGLTNGTPYTFKAFVRNNSDWSTGWHSIATTIIPSNGPVIPAVPQLNSPADGNGSVGITPQLTWNFVYGATSYRVQVSLQPDFSSFVLHDSTSTGNSVLLKPLQVKTKYYWKVSASNMAGSSDFSTVFTFTTASAYQVPQQIILSGHSGASLNSNIVSSYKPSATQGYPPPALFGEVYKLPNGTVRCVYTGLESAGGSGMNVEHSFPQSKGASGQAKSDMNHLFPTQNGVNSDRGNYPFGNIPDNEVNYWYNLSTKTPSKPAAFLDEYSRVKSGVMFEPRADHKGNVARAMFYFYTMYKNQADAADANFFNNQKNTLYAWNYLDPVDSLEYARALIIAKYQSNKANPYVLDTTLIRRGYFPQYTVGVAKRPILPIDTHLEQNFPNPFNPATTVQYSVSSFGQVTLTVYDLLGREVSTLVNEMKESGNYSVSFDASALSSGMYFCRLQSGSTIATKKITLLK